MEEIKVHLDKQLKKQQMTSKDLAEKIGITEANLSILKTGKAKGIRFNTLMSICRILDCQPGDILEYEKGDSDEKSKFCVEFYTVGVAIRLCSHSCCERS